jgi:hypothetical protein
MAKVTPDAATGRLNVELAPLWKMTEVPGRIAPGHGACPGCGAIPTLRQIDRDYTERPPTQEIRAAIDALKP